MSSGVEGGERVEPATLDEWRAWLAANHDRATGVWLVLRKPSVPGPGVRYVESVEQALCFGWVDSKAKGLDAERTMQYFTPRRARSGWARPNKQRIERLLATGQMAPAGLAVVEAAKADGSWTLLDDVEDLVVPDDLAAAFDARPGSREQWEAFPRSPRRLMLVWLVEARRPETRAKRVAEIADRAAVGERARG
ncbi:YdeI/OmpD-associated family protein [Pseudonocardia humida]|uniref:YdeI/OmpD-associated family protein n=1 Tax=Pseudonocardia humida TaxID=2800819 RepID=A0ABT0ZU80_9PSEU|nr:YdeI/OmpD-associated family protein [Pseudonocardia humida]MCO1654278.1 YdeI/OmpD-associated family protein [Pseudonocardia humida]